MAQPQLSPEEQAAANEVLRLKKVSEDYNAAYRRRCDELYAHYLGFKGLDSNLRTASPPDRDTLLRDAQSEWGSDLVIPFAFSTVETILPRAVSNRPRMLILPVDMDAEKSVQNMRYLIEQQQQKNQYEMKLEETAKSGFIYGLGVQKLFWKTTYVDRPSLQSQLVAQPDGSMIPIWIEGPDVRERDWDDWAVEDIDIADLFWDPYASDIESCKYIIHRTWLTHKDVLDRLRGPWRTDAAQALEEDDVKMLMSSRGWSSAHGQRSSTAGFPSSVQGDDRHEVLEAHLADGSRVISLLDGQIPVQIGKNPARHKQLPFSAFRPSTAGRKQLPGLGAIQPIEQLLREMSTLRSQRRDNAALKLAQVFAYSDGAIDEGDLQFFPGAAIPVHGEPKDFLYPINVGDIPNSSYQEEAAIVQDVERTSGISDTVTGADAQGSAQTATGVQLIQAAANIRIQRQTRRLEVELVSRSAGQAVAWNQQMVVARQSLEINEPVASPGVDGPVSRRRKLTPPELWGRMTIDVEGGSTAPKNMQQQIQLAQQLGQDFGNDPHVDQRALTNRRLELYGFTHPDAYLLPDQAPLNPDILERLQKAGVDQGLIEAAVQMSQRENPMEGRSEEPPQGPSGASEASTQARAAA